MDDQIEAVQAMKQAAMGLSDACLAHLRVPGGVTPLTKLYDQYLLQERTPVDMTVLLGKIK